MHAAASGEHGVPGLDLIAPRAGRRHEVALVRIGAQARAGLALRHVDFEMLLGTPDSLMKVA